MNPSLIRRLRKLECRFPEKLLELSGVPMRDLETLEAHMERFFAGGDIANDWESALPVRLRQILRQPGSRQSTRSRKGGETLENHQRGR